MEIKWTSKALSDLVRLYEFLAPGAFRQHLIQFRP